MGKFLTLDSLANDEEPVNVCEKTWDIDGSGQDDRWGPRLEDRSLQKTACIHMHPITRPATAQDERMKVSFVPPIILHLLPSHVFCDLPSISWMMLEFERFLVLAGHSKPVLSTQEILAPFRDGIRQTITIH